MTVLRLAIRNVLGAGLKTWLNVAVLSLAFVVIVWVQGFYDGVNQQALDAIIDIEYAGGQFWHEEYDKYDPLTLEQSHGKITSDIQKIIDDGDALPILTTLGAIYPHGRMISLMIKGVKTDQDIIPLPSHVLENGNPNIIPALIGTRMAEAGEIEKGDIITMRWRDANGTFDATDIEIVEIMNTIAPSIDAGQIWIPIETLRDAMGMPNEATVITVRKNFSVESGEFGRFYFMLPEKLLEDMIKVMEGRNIFWMIMYVLLSSLGLLAIFDTQMLAVFRRRKEMGMLMALGMTRRDIIGTFTVEGAIQGVLSVIVAFAWGFPLCYWTMTTGFRFGNLKEGGGFAIPTVVYPDYSPQLVLGTVIILMFFITLVSFLPARRVVKLKPTDALRGRWS